MEVVFYDFHLSLCIIGDKSISKPERNVGASSWGSAGDDGG